MSSYYNRPWQGRLEVRNDTLTTSEWTPVGEAFGSVEAGLAQARLVPAGLPWRVVDAGGNAYESSVNEARWVDPLGDTTEAIAEFKLNHVPADVAARQFAFYKSLIPDSIHIRESERRRLLEDALKEDDERVA